MCRIQAISQVEDVPKYDDGETVLVLRDTFPKICRDRSYLHAFLEQCGDVELCYQRNCQGVVTKSKASLHKVQKQLLFSCHDDSILVMDENILSSGTEALLEDAPSYLKDDWFRHFPQMLRPSPLCLILGGVGARSDLHADPLSWTGWNCLLEGSKTWRFYCHEPADSPAFSATRRPFGIKSGPHELCSIGTGMASHEDTWALGCQLKASEPLEYVQRPGETLIFPGHWWHQTYHLTATVGFAGQLLNQRNLRRVMEHVTDWCGMTMDKGLWELPHEEVIAHVLAEAIDSM
ncbi:unnamed protein product [Durusdinium trenchii]|uniref:JmjC domain-containing protein n=2 Tax=Durusdinium trenchii TaxID=1381693 RepID=A0ABP0JNI7_9DINO